MSHAYSLDLRRRIIALIEQGYSRRAAARHFMVSPKFVVNLKRRWSCLKGGGNVSLALSGAFMVSVGAHAARSIG